VRDVVVHNCSVGSSCYGWTTGVEARGQGFADDSRVKLNQVSNGDVFFGSYQGGNGKTRIITDFYNLPLCTTFNVTVFGSTGTTTYQNGVTTVCL